MSRALNPKADWGQSYGQMVAKEFFKNRLNVASLCYIVFLFFLAVFAPFLANDKPYRIVIDGRVEYPLLRNLQAVDYSILWAALLGCVLMGLMRYNNRRVDPSVRSQVFFRQFLVVGVLLFVGIGTFYALIPQRLDARDYRRMTQTGKASGAVFAPVPFGFDRTNLPEREQPPGGKHWLGTDDVGADLLARLIHGSRISLSVGFVAVGISSLIGILYGALLGYFGGWVDFIGMRLIEIMMAIPLLLLIMTIIAFFPRNLFTIMCVIGVVSWTGDARFIRAEFFRLRKQDYVQAARALGLPLHSILFTHMLPNGVTPILVNVPFGIAGAIFLEAALSFLGLGVAPPTPSWGQMLSLAVNTTGQTLWWLSLFPGLAIFLTALAYNLVGEGLRDAIDPRLRKAA